MAYSAIHGALTMSYHLNEDEDATWMWEAPTETVKNDTWYEVRKSVSPNAQTG